MLIAEPDSSIPICQTLPEGKRPDSFLPTIQEKMKDPNYSANEVLHLIAVELVQLYVETGVHQKNAKAGFILRNIRAQFQALRGIENMVRRTEALRKKEDQLDFDGPKFLYVLQELLKGFDQAIQKTLGRDDPVTSMAVKTAKHIFRGILEKREPDLRREVARMR